MLQLKFVSRDFMNRHAVKETQVPFSWRKAFYK